MTTAFLLVFAGVMFRLLPHPMGMVPVGAVALYAGARLPRRWALTVPLAIWVVSDLALDLVHGYPFYSASRLTTYGFFTAMALWASFVPKDAGVFTRAGMAVGASTLFFLLSNFAVWAEGSGYVFPRTLSGLALTYEAGLPFYLNMLAADLAGTAVLFGAEAVAARLLADRSEAAESVA